MCDDGGGGDRLMLNKMGASNGVARSMWSSPDTHGLFVSGIVFPSAHWARDHFPFPFKVFFQSLGGILHFISNALMVFTCSAQSALQWAKLVIAMSSRTEEAKLVLVSTNWACEAAKSEYPWRLTVRSEFEVGKRAGLPSPTGSWMTSQGLAHCATAALDLVGVS